MPPTKTSANLTLFYESTSGDDWHNNSGWLVGDPCVGEWFGVDAGAMSSTVLPNLRNFPTNLAGGDLFEDFDVLAPTTTTTEPAVPTSFTCPPDFPYMQFWKSDPAQDTYCYKHPGGTGAACNIVTMFVPPAGHTWGHNNAIPDCDTLL